MQATGNGANTGMSNSHTLGDITDFVSGKLDTILTSTSYTAIQPLGKDKSMHVLSSQKQGPMGQDFDTKSYVGGGVPLKTYTYPDNVAKIVLGKSGLVKDIQVSGTFREIGELEIIAGNFYDSNERLRTINLTTQGMLEINSVSNVLGFDNFIIDKITYDYAQNGTIIEGRAALD